jgi:hypothetical protein
MAKVYEHKHYAQIPRLCDQTTGVNTQDEDQLLLLLWTEGWYGSGGACWC